MSEKPYYPLRCPEHLSDDERKIRKFSDGEQGRCPDCCRYWEIGKWNSGTDYAWAYVAEPQAALNKSLTEARLYADAFGTGVLLVRRGVDGRYTYQPMDPSDVTFHSPVGSLPAKGRTTR